MGDAVVESVQTVDDGATDEGTTNTLLTDDVTTGDDNSGGSSADAEGSQEGGDGDAAASSDDGSADAGEGSQTPPEVYADFDLPEGMELDAAALESVTPLMKEVGLSQEQAQKLVSWYADQVQADSQSQVDAFNQLMQDWQTQTRNDSEIGGEDFEKNLKTAQAAITKFGTPELKQLLKEHGVGNHPELIRFMVKVGRLTLEDVPGAEGKPPSKAQDRVSVLYRT